MNDSIQLIVGLGNPGSEYHQTRHNAGFDFLDCLAQQQAGQWKKDSKYKAEICSINLKGHKVWLMKPMTFMNRSGQSVAPFANFYKIPADQILVAHDELDIEAGTARFKKGGGHGGHNGLRDIIASLGNNKDFYRLRLGIGHPGQASEVVNYVLRKAPADDYIALERAIDCAIDQLPLAISGDWAKAMNHLHSFKLGE
ncbi:aminoacyl-tRNA hydrolase [Reinekea thalattae]|uniref:Peptidyl-tRNA hydrolase n=1 Tax=Reinekea thalattae TaxID=2593301 RepID=A0A5C8Z8S5_9GAMM|nr:aminoacyl-tRNA hydrolase [Reinekea thalattae]TXR53754.1 aminoacyl-tRNA hydrolase [Reinekea thalattae]